MVDPTTSNGSVGTNFGYANLPSSFTTIFNKTASAYSANDYLIEARKSGAVLTFRVTFNEDKGPNPNFDEAVTASTSSTAQLNRPNNSVVLTYQRQLSTIQTTYKIK